jgi:perosamine synthetase
MIKPISISLSPNTEKDDVRLAFRLKSWPWRKKSGKETGELENEFKNYLGVKHAISFNSGRSSLMAIFSSLGFNKGEEILMQAFTCNAVANPIIWSGLKPVYVDCREDTFNIDAEDLKRKITLRQAQGKLPKALIVQNTFGLPAEMDKIVEICRQYHLVLIEDCAHALGATYKGKKLGTLGDVSFFSFSRDKVISSVYGGMVATNNEQLAGKIREYQEKIGYPSFFWIWQQLEHPVSMSWLILPTYKILGKYILVLYQWLHILSKAVHWKEKRGLIPGYFPKRMPNSLAILALNQFKKLERFNVRRKEIADFYREELKGTDFQLPRDFEQIYLRFTIKHPRAHEIIRKAWDNNLLIGDWYTSAIAPPDTQINKMHYIQGSCPVSEKLAKITLNLPTHINISINEAKKVVGFLKNYGS